MTATRCVSCRCYFDNCDCERPYKGASLSQLPVRILDLLEVEAGWSHVENMALRLDASPSSVRQALKRLRGRGLVESRIDVKEAVWRLV